MTDLPTSTPGDAIVETQHNRPTEAKLNELIEQLRDAVTFDFTVDDPGMSDGYRRSADAMWKAALAAFNWAASEVGASGFQASWAALRFYGEAMHVTGPFMILKAEDAIYPQYDLPRQVNEWLDEQRGWLAEEAKKHLDNYEAEPTYTTTNEDGTTETVLAAHPRVVAHWRKLVAAALGGDVHA